MKVKDIMTTDVAACRPESNLAEVAAQMFHRDCGCLPVVGADGHVAGVITDRDMAIALATRNRTADRIEVREVMTGHAFACAPDDTIKAALETMRRRRVRRLPVVDDQGLLKGILSLNDIVLHAGAAKRDAPSAGDVLNTMQAICSHDQLLVTGAA
jgi:CBS domain-containing protein